MFSMVYTGDDGLTSAVKDIEKLFPEVSFTSYGGSVPVQAEGNIGGKVFYFRFRGDRGSLTVGDKSEDKYLPINEIYVEVEDYTGDAFNGFLTGSEFKELFILLLKKIYQVKVKNEP